LNSTIDVLNNAIQVTRILPIYIKNAMKLKNETNEKIAKDKFEVSIEVGNFIEKDWEMKKEKINENEENKEQNFKFSDLIDNKKTTFKAGQIMKRKE
jgi:hypothetical protein